LEASASRRNAHAAFKSYLNEHPLNAHKGRTGRKGKVTSSNNETVAGAIAVAQKAELDSFQMLNLSVQELVDCDNAANEGCTGGNPLLSFYFIHRYGLTSWEVYPYVGFDDACHNDWTQRPIATGTCLLKFFVNRSRSLLGRYSMHFVSFRFPPVETVQ